jgi:hypothetical protein
MLHNTTSDVPTSNNHRCNKTLKIITININGGWDDKKAELQEWTNRHHPDVIMIQEIKCNKNKGQYVALNGSRGFKIVFLQKSRMQLEDKEIHSDEETEQIKPPRPLLQPLYTHQASTKWGTAILIHNNLTGTAREVTPKGEWAKGSKDNHK